MTWGGFLRCLDGNEKYEGVTVMDFFNFVTEGDRMEFSIIEREIQ